MQKGHFVNESMTTGFAMSSSSLAFVAADVVAAGHHFHDGLLALVERRVLQQVLHAVREVRVPDLRRVLGMPHEMLRAGCDGAWKADAAAQSASATARRGIVSSSGLGASSTGPWASSTGWSVDHWSWCVAQRSWSDRRRAR